jgi:hypothetical protein
MSVLETGARAESRERNRETERGAAMAAGATQAAGRRNDVRPGRLLVTALFMATLLGCGLADQFSAESVEYNAQAETIKNQNLLNNIIRSAYRRPLQFTDLTTITGQVSVSGTGAFFIPFGGPRSGSSRTYTFSPSVTASDTPNFTVAVLNTKEFYNGILAPIPLQTLAYYLHEGFPPHVLLTILISEIVYGPNNSFQHRYNEPNDFAKFYDTLSSLIDNGLTIESTQNTKVLGPPLRSSAVPGPKDLADLDAQGVEIVGYVGDNQPAKPEGYYRVEKRVLSYRFCFDPSRTHRGAPPLEPGMPKLAGAALCGAREREQGAKPGFSAAQSYSQQSGIHALQTGAEDEGSLSFRVRSVEGVIYYLGEWARSELGLGEPAATPIVTYTNPQGEAGENILFQIGRGTGRGSSIDTAYQGSDYHINVDPTGHDRTSQVMELVTELLALNNSAKDLPAPSVLPVITR